MEVALGPRVPVHLEAQAQKRETEKNLEGIDTDKASTRKNNQYSQVNKTVCNYQQSKDVTKALGHWYVVSCHDPHDKEDPGKAHYCQVCQEAKKDLTPSTS
jgi:hypothetical protein